MVCADDEQNTVSTIIQQKFLSICDGGSQIPLNGTQKKIGNARLIPKILTNMFML